MKHCRISSEKFVPNLIRLREINIKMVTETNETNFMPFKRGIPIVVKTALKQNQFDVNTKRQKTSWKLPFLFQKCSISSKLESCLD